MNPESIKKLNDLLNNMPVTKENEKEIKKIRELLEQGDYEEVFKYVSNNFQKDTSNTSEKSKKTEKAKISEVDLDLEEEDTPEVYPKELSNPDLEKTYIGLLLDNPKSIVKYYFLHKICYFEDPELLNIYKSVLFTEGGRYTPEIAKKNFNFARITDRTDDLKYDLKASVHDKDYDMEKIYVELMKLFIIRKKFLEIPIKEMQDKIVEITNYKLYDKMSIEEVEAAINQVTVTGKFKSAILNKGLTQFLEEGANNLTQGLEMPFSILTSVFKGIRKGETMAFAMPSNAGKSRFTINMVAYTALVHKKKVLIISNEMSEEKMKLCLITTILNNPEIQKIYGQKLKKSEGELLSFKFRPDNPSLVEVDENGFVVKKENETRKQFVKRLQEVSTEFNQVIKATEWINKEIDNSIYFVNITDHTNEELQKVIINYYYKEKIQYVFYDTLKTDTANIGIGEEIKRTATILSNIAQNFEIFIFSTLQLAETSTAPVNLTINDLAVSRTVKEVLDTLCLVKQINREDYDKYEYSLNEADTKFFDLKKYDDPDVRYYACVVDKNRAGAKPTLLFRLNLAYNSWEELGYLKLKHGD